MRGWGAHTYGRKRRVSIGPSPDGVRGIAGTGAEPFGVLGRQQVSEM